MSTEITSTNPVVTAIIHGTAPPRVVCCALLLLTLTAFDIPVVSSQTGDVTFEDRSLGQKLYRNGQYAEALLALKKAVKTDKSDSESWYYLGLTYLRQRDFKAAIKAFETTLQLKSDSAPARSGLAYAYLLRNKPKEAIKESERAIELDANIADAHFVLGVASFLTGERDKALKEAETAIKLNDKLADAYLLKSQILVQFHRDVIVRQPEDFFDRPNKYEEAAAALEKYLQLNPTSREKELWSSQLEALRFHTSLGSIAARQRNNVYHRREVTTPVRLISKPEPQYTEAARANSVRGTVVIRALFAEDGKVKHIIVMQGLPDGLTWVSVKAAQQIKFHPATLDGRPVSMLMQLEYNFNIF